MNDDEKGQKFLELIDKQNTLQLAIIQNLSILIQTSWNDEKYKAKLESLMLEHKSISAQLNELDSYG